MASTDVLTGGVADAIARRRAEDGVPTTIRSIAGVRPDGPAAGDPRDPGRPGRP